MTQIPRGIRINRNGYGPGGFGFQIPPPQPRSIALGTLQKQRQQFHNKKKKKEQRPATATLAYRVKKIVLAILIGTDNFLLLPQSHSFFLTNRVGELF